MLVLNQRSLYLDPTSELVPCLLQFEAEETPYRLHSRNRFAERHEQANVFQGKISKHAGAIREKSSEQKRKISSIAGDDSQIRSHGLSSLPTRF